jgi:hypothetical protein
LFEATVDAFAAALDDPAAPPPPGTRGRLAGADRRRFSVYRNNVAAGLIGAIEARFPVTRRIAGPNGFRAAARAFIAAHKPKSAVLIAYGDAFPDFLAARPDPGLSRLTDVARLENAWVEAYHAAEAPAATLADLAALAPDVLPDARVVFHPAARLLSFPTPAASLWARHQDGADGATPQPEGGEDILITRPGADVLVRALPPGGYRFARCLKDGATFAGASGALPSPDGFGVHLVGLVEAGAIAAIISRESP